MVKNIITDKILIESKTARETQLAQIHEERATFVLNKIKSLYFALWQGKGIATTEEMSDFYEDVVEKVIPAQTQEIEKLKLELEVAKAQRGAAEAQQKLLAASSALAIINPSLPALVLGRPDAVITKKEVIEKTILVNSKGRAIKSYEGLSKTKLAKRYGMSKARDLVDWLRSIDKEDVLKPGLTATSCQYIPYSEIAELDKLWASRQGSRQFLIGE